MAESFLNLHKFVLRGYFVNGPLALCIRGEVDSISGVVKDGMGVRVLFINGPGQIAGLDKIIPQGSLVGCWHAQPAPIR